MKERSKKIQKIELPRQNTKTKSMSSSDDDDSDDDDDLFYAPSYKTRRKEREESARRDFSLEDNNNNNNSNDNTSSSNSDDDEEDGDGIDDGKKRRQSGGEREEEERKRRCLMSDDDEEEKEGKEKETTARVGAETKVSDSDTDGEKTESEKYNDDKLREASALMRELTKKTDARELEDDEGFVVDDDEDDDNDNNNNDGARVSDVNNAGDDDDNMRYEPIQLVFAFSNTNRVEFETSKRYTFERIWKDFVKEHQSKGDIAKAKLTFDGDRIKVSEDTPESLDMDDEDVIDVNA